MLQPPDSSMGLAPKVVWSEGMYIGPHHFQMQSRHFEDSFWFTASSLWFAPYGLAGVQLDAEALENDTVVLLHARGFFPDGLPFNMPETDALPVPRSITTAFPPTRDSATLLLGVPARKPRGLNCALDGMTNGTSPESRYLAEIRVMPDENTGSDERPIQL